MLPHFFHTDISFISKSANCRLLLKTSQNVLRQQIFLALSVWGLITPYQRLDYEQKFMNGFVARN
jgi:hypothetical protein